MTQTLLQIFPDPKDLLALEPEELGGVLLEVVPGIMQSAGFTETPLVDQLYAVNGPSYPNNHQVRQQVIMAIAEAINWLVNQGLLMLNPTQSAQWYVLTRRGQSLKNRTDVETYRKGKVLPVELLQPILVKKVRHLFMRGDHDTAVFQAFKEVEVAVRKAANAKGATIPDSVVGRDLMRQAFHIDTGALRNNAVIPAERDAEVALFVGAMGHAKNPTGHRDVNLAPQEAARLIVFASYLLSIVENR